MFGKPLLLFNNMLTSGNVVVSGGTAAGDYNLAYLYDYRPYTWWLSSTAGYYSVASENGADVSADFIYLAGENFNNATLTLTSFDAGYVNPVNHLSAVNLGQATQFFASFTSHSQRIWRVIFNGAASTALSQLMIGNKLELPRYLRQGFDPLGSKPKGRIVKSEKGHPLGTAESWREWKQKIDFRNIDIGWLRSTWEPAFNNHLKYTPGVFVWDPVDHADELYLVHPIFEYSAPHVQGQFCNFSFTLEGLAA